MDEHTYPTRQPSALDSAMDLVRNQPIRIWHTSTNFRPQESHLLSERIQRMKRQDLALLTKRFHTALEKKIQTTKGCLEISALWPYCTNGR